MAKKAGKRSAFRDWSVPNRNHRLFTHATSGNVPQTRLGVIVVSGFGFRLRPKRLRMGRVKSRTLIQVEVTKSRAVPQYTAKGPLQFRRSPSFVSLCVELKIVQWRSLPPES